MWGEVNPDKQDHEKYHYSCKIINTPAVNML